MSLFDEDLTLPGVSTEIISDYDLGYDTSLFGTTDEVSIIGTAFNGPVGKPIKVYSPEHAQYIFGPVYDSATRKQATLVGNIIDAWNRGCRSIYAVRVSGKPIYKDYKFACDTNLKLRVKGMFPSNENKDLSMVFNCNENEISISIYKPASRATISEKKNGLVDSSNSILINTIDLYSGGLEKSDELIELINRVNDYTYNNVISLAIVDDKGDEVTLSSKDAKSLKIGDMFPGLYTIGRDTNAEGISTLTETKMKLIKDDSDLPYIGFEGSFYTELVLNTNVALEFPIFTKEKTLDDYLKISSVNKYDFLTVPNKIDTIFLKDNVDYGEVELTDFELFKKLGSSFATNAQLSVTTLPDGSKKYRVKEVTDNKAKKSEIKDGIYSALENISTTFRVLADVSADTQIKGTLPKKEEFKKAKMLGEDVFNETFSIEPIVDSSDFTKEKEYKLSFNYLDAADPNTELYMKELEEIENKIYETESAKSATYLTYDELVDLETKVKKKNLTFKEGSLFLVYVPNIATNLALKTYAGEENDSYLLYTFTNGKFVINHEFVAENKDKLVNSLVYANNKIYIADKKVVDLNTNLITHTFSEIKEVLKEKVLNKLTQTYEDVEKPYIIVTLYNGSFIVVKTEKTESYTIPDPTYSATVVVDVQDSQPLDGEGHPDTNYTLVSDPSDVNNGKYVKTAPNPVPQSQVELTTVYASKEEAEAAGVVVTTIETMGVKMLGTAESVLSTEEDKMLIALNDSYNTNEIIITSNQFDFLTIDELVDILNNNKDFNKLFKATVLNISKAQEYVLDELTPDYSVMFKDKEVIYDENLLIPYRTDDTFGRQLAQHCFYTSMKTGSTHGVIGTSTLLDLSLEAISNNVDRLCSLNLEDLYVAKKPNGVNMLDNNNMPYPIGRKISVINTQYYVTTDDNFTFISNGAAGYAGMVSTLPLNQSSTCQPINLPDPMYELSNYQLSSLSNAGFVTVKQSYTKGWVITDGITMAPANSPYKRLSASRVADGVENAIRQVAEPYIGLQNSMMNQNALKTGLKSKLTELMDVLIESFDFEIVTDKSAEKLGIIYIDYAIIPLYEIKQIINRITIS